MANWFRSWHGAPTDPKWRTIARLSSSRPGDVFSVVWYLNDRASQSSDRGSFAGFDVEVIADAFGYEPEMVERVVAALRAKGVITEDNRIAAWRTYQPEREDGAAERAQAWRDRKKAEAEADKPQLPLPEEGANAGERKQTQPNAPVEKPAKRRRARTEIAEDAQPTDADKHYAYRTIGMDEGQFRAEWQKFRNSHRSRGSVMADWAAAWRTWADRFPEYQRSPNGRTAPAAPRNAMFAAGEQLLKEAHERNRANGSIVPPSSLSSGFHDNFPPVEGFGAARRPELLDLAPASAE